jgi:hypothetical protein
VRRIAWTCLALAMMSASSFAREYTCRNEQLEITCTKGKCERADSFTPASVSIDTSTRSMSVCLYATCFDGKASQLVVNRRYVIARGDRLKANSGRGSEAGVMVIDLADKSGVLVTMSYRSPITCEVR